MTGSPASSLLTRSSGLVLPRWGTPRRPERPTRGNVDAAVARLLGWEPFDWQQYVFDVAGEYDAATNRPYYRTVGVSVARQNGKTAGVCTRVARQLILPKQHVAYTAQDRSLARTKWMEHVELLMDTPFAKKVDHYDKQQNREVLVMTNGSTYRPVTPSTKKAGRSLSLDLAVIDEAFAHDSMGVLNALRPTLITRPLAQIWILSNAGDADSVLWWYFTELGRRVYNDPDATLAWFEWAAPDDADITDPEALRAANPSVGQKGGVDPIALASEALEATGEGIDVFKREHLNLWVDRSSSVAIDERSWRACEHPELVPGERIALGLALNRDRTSGTLVSAGLIDGVTPLEVVDQTGDFDSLVMRAAANANQFGCDIVILAGSPAASAIPQLKRLTAYGRARKGKERPHRVREISPAEGSRAVGDFYDAVTARRLSHRSDPRLDAAVSAAARRNIGDSFTWERRIDGDISALDAATWARWGVLTAPEPEKPAQARIARPVHRVPARGRTPITAARIPARR